MQREQTVSRVATARMAAHAMPAAPPFTMEQREQLVLGAVVADGNRIQDAPTQLPLAIISKGRFDKSEPTIHKGEDLDIPTYIRRGVALNYSGRSLVATGGLANASGIFGELPMGWRTILPLRQRSWGRGPGWECGHDMGDTLGQNIGYTLRVLVGCWRT